MRITLAVVGAMLGSTASAHETEHRLAGEHPLEEERLTDAIWDLVIPTADASAAITVKGNYRYIRANGYPNKAPGKFPSSGNPHSISKKNYQLKVPASPRKSGGARAINNKPFGIALNGVLMDPGTAEAWQNNRRSGWNYEALGGACKLGLDRFNAHVQPDGTYHYHAIPTGVLASGGGSSTPALLGYAADGFPIYGPYGYSNPKSKSQVKKLKSSYAVKSGTRPNGPGGRYNGKFTQDWTYVAGRGDLDQCNGRFAVTPEYPNGTYQYILTDTFPFIPRCWMGSPDSSFSRLKSGAGGARRGAVENVADMTINAQADAGGRPRLTPFGQRPPRRDGRRPGNGPRNGQARGGGRGGPCQGS